MNIAWLNPTRDRIDEANRLYKSGKYEEAITKYGEVLVDNPDSPLLNFNMGDAHYKAGKYSEALASYGRVKVGEDDPKRLAKTAYNAGNVQYRLGVAAESSKPQDALKAYALALAAYRRALGADPTDQDAKFNYEFVSKKIAALKKKLEEQKQQQEQEKQDQPQEQPQDQEKGDQQQEQEQQQGEQEQEPEQKEQEQAQEDAEKQQEEQQEQQQQAGQGEEQQEEQAQEEQTAEGGEAAGEKTDSMTQKEAAALLDTAKTEELQPEEFARQQQRGARVVEPAQDW